MGTTVSVILVAGSRYLIGQVGDSRVYLLRDGSLRQLTKDHSYVQEQVDAGLLTPEQARYHPYSNVITRCVGAGEDVEPDTFTGEIRAGDVFLIASDGLTGMVDDKRLQQLLLSRASAGRVVDALIAEANYRGGLDNITAIVVQIQAVDSGKVPPATEGKVLEGGEGQESEGPVAA
jgi:protein phosphatase